MSRCVSRSRPLRADRADKRDELPATVADLQRNGELVRSGRADEAGAHDERGRGAQRGGRKSDGEQGGVGADGEDPVEPRRR
jgi:hypothetical protein